MQVSMLLQEQCQALGVPSYSQREGIPSGHHPDSVAAEHIGLPAHWPGQDPHCGGCDVQLHSLVS